MGQRAGTVVLCVALLLALCGWASAQRSCPCAQSKWCNRVTSVPSKEVLMFSTSNQYWTYYDWSMVTTLALFQDLNDTAMCLAHSNGAKIVVGASFPVQNLTNASDRHNWINSMINMVEDNFLDGINVDIEDPIANNSVQANMLTVLMQETYQAFKKALPGCQITFDVGWSPRCIDQRCYDYAGLAKWSDFLVVMGYDLRSEIFPPQPCIAGANSGFPQIIEGIKAFKSLGISSSKLVLGQPWYGHDFVCIRQTNATVCPLPPAPWRGVNCTDAAPASTEIDFSTVLDLFEFNATSPEMWDPYMQAPYFDYMDLTTGPHQVWYDNPESLGLKIKWAFSEKLKGVAFWTGDYLPYTSKDPKRKLLTKAMWDSIKPF